MDLMWYKLKVYDENKKTKLSELASSFRCNKFEDYICKNGTLNNKNAEIINDELIMCIFEVVISDKQLINQGEKWNHSLYVYTC